MRFSKWPYGEKVTDVETLKRLCQPPRPLAQERPVEPLSLFGEEIHQTPKRSALWTPEQAYRRNQRAKAWRRVRKQVEALPEVERADFLTVWRGPAARRFYSGTPEGLALLLGEIEEKSQ